MQWAFLAIHANNHNSIGPLNVMHEEILQLFFKRRDLCYGLETIVKKDKNKNKKEDAFRLKDESPHRRENVNVRESTLFSG